MSTKDYNYFRDSQYMDPESDKKESLLEKISLATLGIFGIPLVAVGAVTSGIIYGGNNLIKNSLYKLTGNKKYQKSEEVMF